MPRQPSFSDETNINVHIESSPPPPDVNPQQPQVNERDIAPVALPQSAGPVNKDEPIEQLVWLVCLYIFFYRVSSIPLLILFDYSFLR